MNLGEVACSGDLAGKTNVNNSQASYYIYSHVVWGLDKVYALERPLWHHPGPVAALGAVGNFVGLTVANTVRGGR